MSNTKLTLKEKIKPIYSGTPDNFHWAGFGSGTGSNLEALAIIQPPSLVFSDNPEAGLFKQAHLVNEEQLTIDAMKLVGRRPKKKEQEEFLEWEKRSDKYNQKIVDALEEFQQRKGYAIDLIVLGGYMRIVREPILQKFTDRIINVHPGDLTILEGNQRVLIGADAVYKAFLMRMKYTRSSVIIVDSGIDHGEIISQGPSLKMQYPMLMTSDKDMREAADKHQGVQKYHSDHPAFKKAFTLISEGKIGIGMRKVFLNEWRKLYLDNKPLPYNGYEVKENEV